jgi:hypothetical protein
VTAVLALFFFSAATPEQRAVDYLAKEVPRWSRDNHCFSCHNNGDGARALYAARRLGYAVPAAALAETTRWLLQPARWDDNHGNPAASDKKLARIQFAAALAVAWRTGATHDRKALIAAADSLLALQDADGKWLVDTGGLPGAPATYGIALATYMTRRTLEIAGAKRFHSAIARANQWFAAATPASILDAAATLLALPHSGPIKRQCLPMILSSQTSDGGWGPQPHLPAEPFDTAIVLMALNAVGEMQPALVTIMARARAFLVAQQDPTGAWPETTRPGGAQSYAERISTTAWVTWALLDVPAI